jgi:hypothetical protein
LSVAKPIGALTAGVLMGFARLNPSYELRQAKTALRVANVPAEDKQ